MTLRDYDVSRPFQKNADKGSLWRVLEVRAKNIEATPLPFECTVRVLEYLRQAGADKEWDARIPVSKVPSMLSESLRETVFGVLSQIGPKIVIMDSTSFPYGCIVTLMEGIQPVSSCKVIPTDGIEAWLVSSVDRDSIDILLLALRRCQIKLSVVCLNSGDCTMIKDYGDFVGISRIGDLNVKALFKYIL